MKRLSFDPQIKSRVPVGIPLSGIAHTCSRIAHTCTELRGVYRACNRVLLETTCVGKKPLLKEPRVDIEICGSGLWISNTKALGIKHWSSSYRININPLPVHGGHTLHRLRDQSLILKMDIKIKHLRLIMFRTKVPTTGLPNEEYVDLQIKNNFLKYLEKHDIASYKIE